MKFFFDAAKAIHRAVLESPREKRVGTSRYCHSSLVPADFVEALVEKLPSDSEHLQYEDVVFRVDGRKSGLTLLHYPNFLTVAHPSLCCVHRIDLDAKEVKCSTYSHGKSRPILHRKELLVDLNHPLYNTFARFTEQEEAAGLFAEPKKIGWSSKWEELLKSKGLRIEGHELRSIVADH